MERLPPRRHATGDEGSRCCCSARGCGGMRAREHGSGPRSPRRLPAVPVSGVPNGEVRSRHVIGLVCLAASLDLSFLPTGASDVRRFVEADMRTTNRYDWVLLVLLGLAAAGCATFKNTPQQDYVWEAGRVCDRQVAFWKMDRVESNGHYWIQGATNGPPGRDDYFACMQEQFTRNPYQQWVAQRSGSQAPTSRAGGGGNTRASTSASQPVTNS